MNKLLENIEIVATKFVWFLGSSIFLIFTFWAFRYTYLINPDYSLERVYPVKDGVISNVMGVALTGLIFFAIKKILVNKKWNREVVFTKFFLVLVVLGGIFLGCIWVAITHITPIWDQLQVYYSAIDFRQGNYEEMLRYFQMYPHQYTLVFLYEFVIGIWESYSALQYANVIFYVCIILGLYQISEVLWGNKIISFFTILFAVLYVPLFIYIPYVYGEMCSIAMGTLFLLFAIKWCKESKKRYAVIILICAVIGCLARKNTIIMVIGLVCVLLVLYIKNKKPKYFILGILAITLPLVSIEAVQHNYEKRSGIEIEGGIPSTLWIAMGMQEDYKGAGVFNGYTEVIYRNAAESNIEVANQMGLDYIRGRLKEFLRNPKEARLFYQNKIQGQWNEVTFSSMYMTAEFTEEPQGIVSNIYYGKGRDIILRWMNIFTIVLYGSVMLYAIIGFRRESNILNTLLMVIVIGGVLFSILWEAKGRYVFPYIVLLLPYMATGWFEITRYIERCFAFFKGYVIMKKDEKK